MSYDGRVNAAILNMCAKAQSIADRQQSPLASSSSLNSTTAKSNSPERKQPERTKEDYQWLQNVIGLMEQTEKKISRLLTTVEQDKNITFDEFMSAVEELGDLVEDLNWATEFGLMNGPARTLELLRSHPVVLKSIPARDAVLTLVAHSSQLHEPIQKKYAEAHWESTILPILQETAKDSSSSSVAVALHAVSCLCRSNEVNTVTFIGHGGMEILAAILRRGVGENGADENAVHSEKVLRRTIFLAGSLSEFGLSTEVLMRLICRHMTFPFTSEHLQEAGAQALCELSSKSLKKVKEVVFSEMKSVLQDWKRRSESGDITDSRKSLVSKFYPQIC